MWVRVRGRVCQGQAEGDAPAAAVGWGGSETRVGRGEHHLCLARRPRPREPAARPGRGHAHAPFPLLQ